MFDALSSFWSVTTVLRMNELGIRPAVSSSMKQKRKREREEKRQFALTVEGDGCMLSFVRSHLCDKPL